MSLVAYVSFAFFGWVPREAVNAAARYHEQLAHQ